MSAARGDERRTPPGPSEGLWWSLRSLEWDMTTPRSHLEERRRLCSAPALAPAGCRRSLRGGHPVAAISSMEAAYGLDELLAVAGRRLGQKISPHIVRL